MISLKPKETKTKIYIDFLVFLSSYYPLFLIMFIRDIDSKESILNIPIFHSELNVSSLSVLILFFSSFATIFILHLMRRLLTFQEGGIDVYIDSASRIRGDMLNYTLPFAIGLLAFDYKSYQSFLSFLIFLGFIFFFVRNDDSMLLNPLFLLSGIKLFRIEYRELRNDGVKKNASVLCIGKPMASDTSVCLKEHAGINFLYPCKNTEEK